jgi:hypothetical protein
MATLVHRRIRAWPESKALTRRRVAKSAAGSRDDQTESIGLFSRIMEIAFAVPVAVISSIVQLLIYAGPALMFPFLPFLTPIFAAPFVILVSLSILAFGAVLSAMGML